MEKAARMPFYLSLPLWCIIIQLQIRLLVFPTQTYRKLQKNNEFVKFKFQSFANMMIHPEIVKILNVYEQTKPLLQPLV